MNYNYSLRINILPNDNADERVQELINFCKLAHFNDVIFFIDAEEYNCGHTTREVAKPYVEMLKRISPLLQKNGITLSLNPWITLGHGDRGRVAPKNFAKYVTLDGKKSTLVACPLCENWRNNLLEVYEYFARELPLKTLWFEDDLRMHNHNPQYGASGCFCEKHMTLYCKELGLIVDRESFVKGLVDKNTNTLLRKAYHAVNKAVYDDLGAAIRNRLIGYDVFLGVMTSEIGMYSIEGRDNVCFLNNFDFGKGVFVRTHLPMYRESSPLVYGWGVNCTSVQSRFFSPKSSIVAPEVENYPHSLNSKSATMTAFQAESSLALMPKGCTFNIFDFGGNGVYCGRPFIRELYPLYDYMNAVCGLDIDFFSMSGVIVPSSPEVVDIMQTSHGQDIMELRNEDNWWAGVLGTFGINYEYSGLREWSGKTLAISGDWIRLLDKKQIDKLLKSNKVLFEARAVVCLLDMGLGDLVGVDSYEILQEMEDIYHYQEETSKNLSINNARTPSQYGCGNVYKFNYTKEVEVLTNVKHRLGHTVCKGITRQDNLLILNYEGRGRQIGLMYPLIERIISNFLLGGNIAHVMENGISIYRYCKDKNMYFLFTNFTLDSVDSLTMEGGFPTKNLQYMTKKNPRFTPLETSLSNGEITLKILLPALSTMLVKA